MPAVTPTIVTYVDKPAMNGAETKDLRPCLWKGGNTLAEGKRSPQHRSGAGAGGLLRASLNCRQVRIGRVARRLAGAVRRLGAFRRGGHREGITSAPVSLYYLVISVALVHSQRRHRAMPPDEVHFTAAHVD